MIRGIHHTAISTPDLDRALAFYRDLLGFEQISGGQFGGDPRVDAVVGLPNASGRAAMVKSGTTIIEFFEYKTPAPEGQDPARPVNNHGITHIALAVSDIDGEYERLKAAGIRFHCPPQHMGTLKATYGRDPDGNVFELLETLDADDPHARVLGPASTGAR